MKRSAGVLIYRRTGAELEVLLAHPGGPYWRHRDAGAWQIPKGGIDDGEAAEAAALREVREELGVTLPGPLQPLGEIRQSGGKTVIAFAAEHNVDVSAITSVDFDMEWPPRSGQIGSYPEIDAAQWLTLPKAHSAMLASQLPLLDRLTELLGA